MTNVLVLGSGLVVRPLVRHFLDRKDARVTLASRTGARAERTLAGHPRGRAVEVDVTRGDAVDPLVGECDIVFSMVPYVHHVAIAERAIAHRKPMVTTSYVSPAMRALDGAARDAGVPILNELGLDPGIDHMAAMRIVHRVRAGGGRVVGFTSWCGGLPAPEACDNPFGYKFSWSPRGVVLAARNPALFLRDGERVEVPGERIFEHVTPVHVEGAGDFEGYPNRNSLDYVAAYGIEGVRTMLRGTLRNRGWCATWRAIVAAGWLDETPAALEGRRLGDAFGTRAGLRARLGSLASDDVLDRLEWLGVFSDEPVPPRSPSRLDALANQLERKLCYREGERDMIVLEHRFDVEYPDRAERITATLCAWGEPGGDTAMARTVALPAAIGGELILAGALRRSGVLVPVTPDVYDPILDALERRGIAFAERVSTADFLR